ncbi:unnamed protein product [Linum trigynum]|uniref:RNase H type-1 domain-containing protein n=1 Tax=Linum trigynum TaxID=586398 RepID=A0AAV2CNK0_9ROSI
MEHLFLDCPVARAIWDYAGLAHLGEGLPRYTFPLFLKRLLGLIHQPNDFMAVVVVLWRIWRSRNWVVFEGKQFGFSALMRQFRQQYEEWVRLPVDRAPGGVQATPTHHETVRGHGVICMWDGAVRSGSHSVGGLVLLSPEREVLLVEGVQFPGIDDPLVVELVSLREAVLWCQSFGWEDITFEGDAKIIIDKINLRDARDSRLGAVLDEIIHIFAGNPGFSVRFVGRRSNRVAHLVARKALSLFPTMSRSFDYRTWLVSRV